MRLSKGTDDQRFTERMDEPAKLRLTIFAALCISALLGALFGALCYISTDGKLSELLEAAQESSLSARRSGSLVSIIGGSLISTGFYLLLALMLGFSALAQPFEFALPFLRGMSAGVILTSLYSGGFSKLSFMRTAAVFPGMFLSMIIVVLAAREAIYMSAKLFEICFHDRLYDGLLRKSGEYAVRFAEFAAAASAAALVDCILAILLFGKG